MKDFTTSAYALLLNQLLNAGYKFITLENYLQHPPLASEKTVILRHDVDALPLNSLRTAQIESELGIQGTYYFRIVKQSNDPATIKAIAALKHEIGYHYEDLALTKGDTAKAIAAFEQNLAYFRTFYPVTTICMHGSPLSKFDNRQVWQSYNYKQYGIIGEPYFDIDFNKILYLTDTGRRWDGDKVSVRDKVQGQNHQLSFHSTFDIIRHISQLPNNIMITTHPQRWHANSLRWYSEFLLQNSKNIVKRFIINRNH